MSDETALVIAPRARELSTEDLLRLCDEAAKMPAFLGGEDPVCKITIDQAFAIAQLAADYRRLRGLVDGQTLPCVLYHGVWPEICQCIPRCPGMRCKRQQGGHYLHYKNGYSVSAKDCKQFNIPTFSKSLDGGYAPGGGVDRREYAKFQPQFLVCVTHEQGWTLYGYWDRSCDLRGGSNSVILVEGTHEYKDLARIASRALPLIYGRIGDKFREETPDMYRRLALGGEYE